MLPGGSLMIEWIKDDNHFKQVQENHKDFLILVFYANFSSAAKRAITEIENFSKENKELPVYVIDVEKVKGVHKQFGITAVPTVISLEKGKVGRCIEGVESGRFYSRVFAGALSSQHRKSGEKKSHRVVVYSSPGCPACGAARAYLRRQGISFREIDISRDQHAAERLVRRSGQMAVPQIDIDGHLVVGFDQAKINRLLSI